MASPEWIQESLAKLERLEQEREQHEEALERATEARSIKTHSEAIERLDEEIRSLYTALEAVAGDEDTAPEEPRSASVRTNEFRRDTAPSHAPVAASLGDLDDMEDPDAAQQDDLGEDPFGAPAGGPALPYGGIETSAPVSYESTGMGEEELHESGGGGALKWVLLAVILVGGGGGLVLWKQQTDASALPPPTPTGPPVVISATPVPPDTQGPNTPKGAGVSTTPTQTLKFGDRGGRRGGGAGPSGPSSGQDSERPRKGSGTTIDIQKTDDPLAGAK